MKNVLLYQMNQNKNNETTEIEFKKNDSYKSISQSQYKKQK